MLANICRHLSSHSHINRSFSKSRVWPAASSFQSHTHHYCSLANRGTQYRLTRVICAVWATILHCGALAVWLLLVPFPAAIYSFRRPSSAAARCRPTYLRWFLLPERLQRCYMAQVQSQQQARCVGGKVLFHMSHMAATQVSPLCRMWGVHGECSYGLTYS